MGKDIIIDQAGSEEMKDAFAEAGKEKQTVGGKVDIAPMIAAAMRKKPRRTWLGCNLGLNNGPISSGDHQSEDD